LIDIAAGMTGHRSNSVPGVERKQRLAFSQHEQRFVAALRLVSSELEGRHCRFPRGKE